MFQLLFFFVAKTYCWDPKWGQMLAQVSSQNSICSQSDKPCRFMSLSHTWTMIQCTLQLLVVSHLPAQLLAYSLQKNDGLQLTEERRWVWIEELFKNTHLAMGLPTERHKMSISIPFPTCSTYLCSASRDSANKIPKVSWDEICEQWTILNTQHMCMIANLRTRSSDFCQGITCIYHRSHEWNPIFDWVLEDITPQVAARLKLECPGWGVDHLSFIGWW